MKVLFLSFCFVSFLFSQDFTIDFFISPQISPYIHEWERNPDIFHLKIAYSGAESKNVLLYAEVNHSGMGKVLSGYSREMIFNPGEMKNINSTNVIDWSTVSYHGEFRRIIVRTGRLPEGDYEICVEIKDLSGNTLGRACEYFTITYPSPPNLIYPVDVEVPEILPFFNWSSVSVPWDVTVSYKIRIWKGIIDPFTGRLDIERSIGFSPYFEYELNVNVFNYPVSAPPLEEGGIYIWQVQAFDNFGNPLGENEGRSEFGIFKYHPLPPYIKIGDFKIEVQRYAKEASTNNLSGKGRTYFSDDERGNIYFNVDFSNLRGIKRGDTLVITDGRIDKEFDSPLELKKSDYIFYIKEIHLLVDSSYALFDLEIPYLFDTLNYEPLRISDLQKKVNQGLEIYFKTSGDKIPVFSFGNYGIYFSITDSVIFDLSYSYPFVSIGGVRIPDLSKKIFFKKGVTIKRERMKYSNTGYLYGIYTFEEAVLWRNFFKATLSLKEPFKFTTLVPYGFRFKVTKAKILIDSSKIKGGYLKGDLFLPSGKNGIKHEVSDTVIVKYDSLIITPSLNFEGNAYFFHNVFIWSDVFSVKGISGRICRLRIKGKSPYFVKPDLDSLPFYSDWDTLYGLWFNFRPNDTFYIYSEDVIDKVLEIYGRENVYFHGKFLLSVQGITGFINIKDIKGEGLIFEEKMGRTGSEYYKSDRDFCFKIEARAKTDSYSFYISFVGNSLYDANINGRADTVGIRKCISGDKVNKDSSLACIDIPFKKMNLTSTGSFIGGRIKFSEPRRLRYWEVDITSENGVISVKEGIAIFTHAFISEKRHFSKPFNILWGEIFADGRCSNFYFNKAINQKFDGYPITLSEVSLEESPNPSISKKGALVVKGWVHFRFFGLPDTELTIYDIAYRNTASPFVGRYVIVKPDSFGLHASWGRRYIVFDINKVGYNEEEQNGFKGRGFSEVSFFLDSPVFTLFRSDSLNTLLCLSDPDTVSHTLSFGIGGVPMLKLFDVWGCIFISGDTLRELTIGGYLVDYAQTEEFFLYPIRGSALRTKVNLVVSPTKVRTLIQGEFYLRLVETVRISGYLYSLYKRDELYMDGIIEAEFRPNASELGVLAFGRIKGKVDFHLSEEKFYLMGEVSITTVFNVAGILFGESIHARGNFFLGYNVPKEDIWVFNADYGRFRFRKELIIDRNVTGFFASLGVDGGVDFFVISGRVQIFVAGGLFMSSIGTNPVGQCGVYLRGEILRGLLSAALFADLGLQLVDVIPVGFGGSVGLEVCAAWLLCETLVLDFSITLEEPEGRGGYRYDVEIEVH